MPDSFVHCRSKARFFSGKNVKKIKKKWGEEQWIVNKEYCGKKLILKKNRRCSMHSHKNKDEVFYLQSGEILLELGEGTRRMKPGDFVHIRARQPHRFTGVKDSEIFEFSTTHSEDDSYRTEFSGHINEEKYKRQCAIIKAFRKAKILVVGDVMLDTYVEGSVSRVSPEAPVPVLRYESHRHVPGGAANAARNIAALGGKVTLIGVCGSDEAGKKLLELLKEAKIKSGLIVDRDRWTTEKQRLTGGGDHQMIRLDYEQSFGISGDVSAILLKKYRVELKKCDVVLLSDYAKGVFAGNLIAKCVELAKKAGKPVLLDPKPWDAGYLAAAKGTTVLLPNKIEAQILVGSAGEGMEAIGKELAKKAQASVLLTLGEDGMILVPRKGKIKSFEALADGVIDVSGAGDTVAAAVSVVLACGGSLEDAADLANHAAGIVVGKPGTAVVGAKELLESL